MSCESLAGIDLLLGEQAGLDPLGQLHLLLGVEERNLADLLEVVLDGVGGRARAGDLLNRLVVIVVGEDELLGLLRGDGVGGHLGRDGLDFLRRRLVLDHGEGGQLLGAGHALECFHREQIALGRLSLERLHFERTTFEGIRVGDVLRGGCRRWLGHGVCLGSRGDPLRRHGSRS